MLIIVTVPASKPVDCPGLRTFCTGPSSHIGSMNMDTTGPDSSCSANGTIGFERSAIVLTMKQKLPQLEAESCNDPGTTFQRGRV